MVINTAKSSVGFYPTVSRHGKVQVNSLCSSGLTKPFAYERLFLWRLMHRGCHHSSDVPPLASSDTGKTYDFNTADKLNTLLLNCLLSTRQLKISVPAKWVRTSRQYVLNIYSCNNAYADVFQNDFGWHRQLIVVILRIASSRMVGVRGIYMSLWWHSMHYAPFY